jgi:hypothetical protein
LYRKLENGRAMQGAKCIPVGSPTGQNEPIGEKNNLPVPTGFPIHLSEPTGDKTRITNFFLYKPKFWKADYSVHYLLHAGFLLCLFFDPEDGGDMFLQNVS